MEGAVEDCWGMGPRFFEVLVSDLPMSIASIPPVGGNVTIAQSGSLGHQRLQSISDSSQRAALPFQLREHPSTCTIRFVISHPRIGDPCAVGEARTSRQTGRNLPKCGGRLPQDSGNDPLIKFLMMSTMYTMIVW